jgi:hypothetical protein
VGLDETASHQDSPPCIWVFCDLRHPEDVQFVHNARAAFQERSDLIALGPDHMIVVLYTGLPSERAA